MLADHITGADPDTAYHGSRNATKLKVAGVDVASMGIMRPEREDDEFVRFSEPKRGVYKSVVVRDGKLIGATLVGDVDKVAFLTQSFDRGTPLPEERVELLFQLAGPAEAEGAAEMDDAVQVCNCNGVSKGAITPASRAERGRSPASCRRPGPARAAGRASRWWRRSSNGRPTVRSRWTRRPAGTCRPSRWTSPRSSRRSVPLR